MRVRRRALGAAVTLLSLSGGAVGLASTSSASAQGPAATQRVIVVFKNQDPAQPATASHIAARKVSFQQTQSPILSQLRARGATDIHTYSLLDAVAATVSSSEASALKSNPAVREVIPDQVVQLAPLQTTAPGSAGPASGPSAPGSLALRAHAGRRAASRAGSSTASSVCSSTPELAPEALSLIHADSATPGAQTARSLGFDGSGVKVGFIADGLDINNPDFIRPDGSHVFVDYKDFTGEGTGVPTGGAEAFGDASSIAAQGRQTYNVAGYGPNGSTSPCNIRVEGVAPGASLVGLDVFGAENGGYNSSFLDAINYAVTVDHVNVLNESLGTNNYPDDQATLDLIKQANDDAVAAGTTVTASSGDAGVTNTIGSPATDPAVISAGATTSYRVDLQTGYGGAQFPGVTGYLDNNISSFSSTGFQQDGRAVDIVAPGELGWALCSTDVTLYSECRSYAGKPTPVLVFGGTSEAAPLTAGVVALVDQAYQKTHGTYPSPAVVKQIITSTANDVGSPADQQGAGLIDAYQATLAAESYKAPGSAPTPQGQTLLKSSSQLNAVDPPSTPETLSDTVTNNGSTQERIHVSTRTLGAYRTVKTATVTLSDSSSPKTTDFAGAPSNYEPITFHVGAGEDRLNASAAFQNNNQLNPADPALDARVRITLVDPSGNLAAYSVPQGDGNYGNVQVTDPAPGTWTAYIWSRTAALGGTNGPVLFGASVAKDTTLGQVSPHTLTLAPGQSAPVTLSVKTPGSPGDKSESIVFSGIGKTGVVNTSTVPVTLRSLIPSGYRSFHQTLTGGNGRSVITGQTFYYQMDVGANPPELNASIRLADNPNNPFTAFLVGPNGEAQAIAANALQSADGSVTNELGAQLHVLDPAQGSWTLIVAFIPKVSGTALSEPFTVKTSQAAQPARVTGGKLPDSVATQLAAGKATTVKVRVRNRGPAPEAFFLDGRLSTTTQLQLASLTAGNSTTVPLVAGNNIPEYLVPTDSTGFSQSATTTGPTPIHFDSASSAGDPDIGSTIGTTATSSFTAAPLAQGLWDMAPDVAGAYGTTGVANETVTTAMSVTTAALDPGVSSPTGDLWQASTNPGALNSLSPRIVGPGRSAEIPVTITPQGTAGTVVKGTLYVDDESSVLFDAFSAPNGDQIAAIPYEYTIK